MSLKSYFRRDDGRFNPNVFIVIGGGLAALILIAFFVGFAVFWIHEFDVNEPKAAQVQAVLENEFRAIHPLPAATPLNYGASHKTQQALVSDTYQTSLTYEDIRQFYDAEVAKNGWAFFMEEQVKDWGRDLGGKEARYCKGEYRATLQYAGKQADYGWDYAFSVSWGLDGVLAKYSEPFHQAGCN